MKNQCAVEPTLIATSPTVHERSILPCWIVIRDLGDQFVVHTEVIEPDRKPWQHQGDYFPKRSDATTTDKSFAAALRKAWARFEERTRLSLRMDPPPAKRLAQVSDIAEAIIKTLLPDDEDDRRDVINEDYQLESDIDTFEYFTGKVIQPEDDGPILRDDIEMEGIERSM
jgi:hypothetical protein